MSQLRTVVFADILGSVSLFETMGNERATQAITRLTQWLVENVEAHGGRVVKTLGDGVLGLFGDASDAVAFMALLLRQHRVRQDCLPLPMQLDIRAGIASGDVVDVDGDCYGDAVNVAARLCERAGPGEIWTTEASVLLAGNSLDVSYRNLGPMELRGKSHRLVLYQVEWRENEAAEVLTMQAGLVSNFGPADSILGQIQFSGHGIDISFVSSDTPVHLGRASHAQLCIDDPRVSRLHARIDWRNSGFLLTDLSSFGTWVRFDGSVSPVRLRRDACILHGSGKMALGMSFSDPSAPVLSFRVAGPSVHRR
ncbi:MAG: FHA domain-containing protein [Acidovorax sp.]|jgi:adenylate cyclase